jgi:hypothetical protein
MRTLALAALAASLSILSLPAHARDERLRFPIADALATVDAKAKLDPKVALYFGDQEHPKPLQSLGTDLSNRKSNFFNKSDREGCEWVFLSAVLALQARARQLGANAVVGIKSVYRGGDFSSSTEYECGAGNVVGGVALRGEFVKLP